MLVVQRLLWLVLGGLKVLGFIIKIAKMVEAEACGLGLLLDLIDTFKVLVKIRM